MRPPARPTRDALLDAAQARFAAEGYAGTSIRELARAVGIKESSVYAHFPSKRAIYDAVLARGEERIAATAAALGAPIGDPARAAERYLGIGFDELERMASGFLALWLRDASFVAVRRILALEQHRDPAAGERLRRMSVEEPLAFQAPLFAELMRRGEFAPADPEAVALAFWGPIHAILAAAEGPDGEPAARRRLALHLAHFRAVHLAPDAGARPD